MSAANMITFRSEIEIELVIRFGIKADLLEKMFTYDELYTYCIKHKKYALYRHIAHYPRYTDKRFYVLLAFALQA